MRLQRLDLTRYGKFTGHSIDFGERAEKQPDLHVIYGPNEAGKSTALAAFLDLLFGIKPQSPFNFLHPYATMRIDGALELAQGVQELGRIKRPHNSLLDGQGRPIPESVIAGELGIDRDSYCTMFCLDDETLEAGGESILASKGDLGQLLFSASAGLADLSRSLLDVRAQADRFYRHRARSGTLGDLKARLAELKAERERIDTLASDYRRLIDTRDRAADHYRDALASRGQIQARLDEVQRHLSALPRLATLRSLRQRLLPLADVPDAPRGWAEDLPKLRDQEIEVGVRLRAVTAEIEQLSHELETIVIDDAVLSFAAPAERLAELRPRHVTAGQDIPERRLRLREVELGISGLLARLERKDEVDPQRLLLTASTTGALRSLIEARSGIDAAMRTAGAELSMARRRLLAARAKLQAATGGDTAERATDVAVLVAAMAEARASDHAARQRLAKRDRDAALAVLADRMQGLQPWRGQADELAAMPALDADTMQRWKRTLDEAEARVERHADERERLATETIRLKAERDAIGGDTGVVTDQEAAAIRTQREHAWAAHRRSLDPESADRFETALRRDDIVAAARMGHLADLARLHQLGQALAVAEAAQAREAELRETAARRLQELRDAFAGAVRTTSPSLPDDWGPAQVETWLARRTSALDARAAVQGADRELQQAMTDGTAAQAALSAALAAAGIPHERDAGVEALLAIAQTAVDGRAELAALQDAIAEHERDVVSREAASRQAGGDDRRWSATWSRICMGCWLGDGGEPPPLAVVREILDALAELGPALAARAGLVDRIGKMEADRTAFRQEVAALAEAMAIPTADADPLDLEARVAERIRRATTEQARRAEVDSRREAAQQRQRTLADDLAVLHQRIREMTAHFGVASLADVEAKLRAVEQRSALLSQAEDAERDIADAVRAPTPADAESVLDAADRAALEAELVELKARFDDHDRRCHELFAAHNKAIDAIEAIGGDARVAEIEEQRRTTLLEIEEGAVHYLRLRAGTAAMERALHAYRERHRSSMMAHASKAFRAISQGAYAGLTTQPLKDSETLIALPAAGGSKRAEELSKGTRFQLYLALRVAGYYEFARSRPAVPFIADDIMETFDDFRAEEAFRLFAEMAEVGQVIYLTHHRHLCEIAARVCPTVKIHDLSRRVSPFLSRRDASDARGR